MHGDTWPTLRLNVPSYIS